MLPDDPVVQRVREARRAIVKECDYDLHKLYERAKQLEAQHKDRLVRYDRAKRRFERAD